MSYERAIDAINCRKTDKIPLFETLINPGFVKKISGIAPENSTIPALQKAYEILDIDLTLAFPRPETNIYRTGGLFFVGDKPGAETNWGIEPTIWRNPKICEIDDILSYNPDGFESRSEEELAQNFGKVCADDQKLLGKNALVCPAEWHIVVHYATDIFLWENFMMATLEKPSRCKALLERFAKLSQKIYRAWAKTDIKIIISHDDIAGTNGPLFHPDWLRENVFPWYKEIWKPLKKKGIKILFISDGNLDSIIDDLVDAGADGFVIEPVTNLERLLNNYGGKKLIMGNIDTKIITFGKKEEIRAEVERCTSIGKKYPGYFLNISGGIPYNVPFENIEEYFKQVRGNLNIHP